MWKLGESECVLIQTVGKHLAAIRVFGSRVATSHGRPRALTNRVLASRLGEALRRETSASNSSTRHYGDAYSTEGVSPVGFESRCLCLDDGGKCFPGDDAIRGDKLCRASPRHKAHQSMTKIVYVLQSKILNLYQSTCCPISWCPNGQS